MRGLSLGLRLEPGGLPWYASLLGLPGLVMAFFVDVNATISGGNVTAIGDASGHGNTWSVGAGTLALKANGIGGKASIDTTVDSGTTYLVNAHNLSSIFTGTSAERMMVMQATSPQSGAFTGALGINWGSDGAAINVPFTDGDVYDDFCTTARHNTITGVDVHTNPVVYGTTSNANEWTIYINGTSAFTTATNTFGTLASPPQLLGVSTGGLWGGQFSAILCFNAELSAANRAAAVSTLRSHYGF